MESINSITYDVEKSAKRIDDILDADNSKFEDKKSIPARDELTYSNGYYVNVTAIFVDTIGSSDMTDEHKRPTLAKMYRSFISECTAIMNSETMCKEISINGDCVWGVFDTPNKSNIEDVIIVIGKLNCLVKILNHKLEKKGYSKISVGIGVAYGMALMIQAGYSGSAINEVVWMGDVVNLACHLCNQAGRDGRKVIAASYTIYNNINEDTKKLFSSFNLNETTYYEGDFVNTKMNNWYKENCK